MNNKTYSAMKRFDTYAERLNYLSLNDLRYDSPRLISEKFYKSSAWLIVRDLVLQRDLGMDLGVIEVEEDVLLVHHIDPITEMDIINNSPKLFDLENLITTTVKTHNKIHYGLPYEVELIERVAGDTTLWRR